MNFASDNVAGASPEILRAVAAVNEGDMPSYGADPVTERLGRRFSELFEREVAVFPVVTGTAANALALSCLVPPWGVVFAQADAHIEWDECGGPEFITGGAKIDALEGESGKLQPEAVSRRLAAYRRGDPHQAQPAAISLTQSTEWGTVYTAQEIAAFGALASREKLALHLDGSRFANAVASTGASPADLTWRAGVDILSFGATKNGALAAEAIVFFDPARAADLPFRRKRAGHLVSKMRFVSAQLEAYLAGDLWLKNAARANKMAKRLAAGLLEIPGTRLQAPVEANGVFISMAKPLAEALLVKGHRFYSWGAPDGGVYRFLTAFNTTPAMVDGFIDDAKACATAQLSI